jgi:hypothetical protein
MRAPIRLVAASAGVSTVTGLTLRDGQILVRDDPDEGITAKPIPAKQPVYKKEIGTSAPTEEKKAGELELEIYSTCMILIQIPSLS